MRRLSLVREVDFPENLRLYRVCVLRLVDHGDWKERADPRGKLIAMLTLERIPEICQQIVRGEGAERLQLAAELFRERADKGHAELVLFPGCAARGICKISIYAEAQHFLLPVLQLLGLFPVLYVFFLGFPDFIRQGGDCFLELCKALHNGNAVSLLSETGDDVPDPVEVSLAAVAVFDERDVLHSLSEPVSAAVEHPLKDLPGRKAPAVFLWAVRVEYRAVGEAGAKLAEEGSHAVRACED